MAEEKIEAPGRVWLNLQYDPTDEFSDTPWVTEPCSTDNWPEYVHTKTCRACDKGLRLAPDGIHYDDERGGQTWGVCDKVVESANTRQRAERAAQAVVNEFQSCMLVPDGYTHDMFYLRRLTDIIAAEFEK